MAQILVKRQYKDQVWFEVKEATMGKTHGINNQIREGNQSTGITSSREDRQTGDLRGRGEPFSDIRR